MPELEIEISVLTPLQRLGRIEDLEIGVHGLYIKDGVHSGLLLPQVATAHNWNRTQFLQQACKKAKLPEEGMASPRDRDISVQFASFWGGTLTFRDKNSPPKAALLTLYHFG